MYLRTVIIFRWMEVYPEKWTVHRIMRVEHDVKCTVHFTGVYMYLHPSKKKIITVISYHLIFNAIKTSKSQFDITNGVAIDVLSVWWMEVYPFDFNQSKSLLHAENKWFCIRPCRVNGHRLPYYVGILLLVISLAYLNPIHQSVVMDLLGWSWFTL